MDKMMALGAALLLSACTTFGGSFCKVARPIYAAPSDQPVISDQLVAALNGHNETGARLCGWKP